MNPPSASRNLATALAVLLIASTSCQSTSQQEYYESSTYRHLLPKSGSNELDSMIAEVGTEIAEPKPELQVKEPSFVEEALDAEEEEGDDEESDEPSRVAERSEATPAQLTKAEQSAFPLEINENVEKWIEYFTVKDRERFQRFLERGERYRPFISKLLIEQGLPKEVYYLAMIESGFVARATSIAGAGGVWQFMTATGRRYGLQVDGYVDERRDPVRATLAAAMYLKDLHNVFQSWYLAMAAYNAGEMRILTAIMRSGTRNFWQLVEKKALPRETMNYIPKFIAAAIIGHNPERFGFTMPETDPMPELASADVPSPIRLEHVASETGLALDVLKELNPHLSRGVTPGNKKTYAIWVPASEHERILSKHDALSQRSLAYAKELVRSQVAFHTVRRGENLTLIARKYGMSVAQLKSLNRLSSNRLFVGRKLKISGREVTPAMVTYRVRRGDNLHKIAKRFGVTVIDLKRLNSLKRNRIQIGQILKVSPRAG